MITFGVKSPDGNLIFPLAIVSREPIPATTGVIRLANAELMAWRDVGNGADVTFGLNSSDVFAFGSGIQASYLRGTAANIAASGILRIPNNVYGVTARNAGNNADVDAIKVNASNRVEFGAQTEAVRAIWVSTFGGVNGDLLSTYGTNGAYVGQLLADAANRSAAVSFAVPSDFAALVKAVAVFIPKGTGDMRVATYTDFAASGEAYQTNTDTIANTLVAVTADQMIAWDISATFTSIAAGDYVGTVINRTGDHVADTVTADVLLLGVLIEYR